MRRLSSPTIDQLDELCILKGLTPTQLIVEAFNGQRARWHEFIAEVMIPLKPREPEIWSEDPLYILARLLMVCVKSCQESELCTPIMGCYGI